MIDILGGKSQFKGVIHSQGVGYKDQTTAMYAIHQVPSFDDIERYDEQKLKRIAMWLWNNKEISEFKNNYANIIDLFFTKVDKKGRKLY